MDKKLFIFILLLGQTMNGKNPLIFRRHLPWVGLGDPCDDMTVPYGCGGADSTDRAHMPSLSLNKGR